MSENGDIEKIIKNDITSKNYPFHSINLKTSDTINYKSTIVPILKFLNDSPYFDALRKQSFQNINEKMAANDSLISQINVLLNTFSSTSSNNQKSDKLVYYNENSQLNDIIKTKENLIVEQGINKINLINSDKIIKEISSVLNIKNFEGTNNKMKYIDPKPIMPNIPFSTQVKISGLCTEIPVYRLEFSNPNPNRGFLFINLNPLSIISSLSIEESDDLGSKIVEYLSKGLL